MPVMPPRQHAAIAVNGLGDPDVLTCIDRVTPLCFWTIRLVCRDMWAAADAPASEMLAEARAAFNRLTATVHQIDTAMLSTLQYEFDGDAGGSDSDSELDELWENAARSFDRASGELLEHQNGALRTRAILLEVQGRVGFLASARSVIHAGALVILHITWSAEHLCKELFIPMHNAPELSLMDFWEEDFLQSILDLVDAKQMQADVHAVHARYGISPELGAHVAHVAGPWLRVAVLLNACERAGLTPPPECSWNCLQEDAPYVIEKAQAAWRQARRWYVQRRTWVARERRVACLHHAIRRMGFSPRDGDSAVLLSCAKSDRSMHLTLSETLRWTVWLHWLHQHTCGGRYWRSMKKHASRTWYRTAANRLRAPPLFRMPAVIPWLPAPHNNVDEVVEAAASAVRARLTWRRAFQRVKCLLVFIPLFLTSS